MNLILNLLAGHYLLNILKHEFLDELGISFEEFSKILGMEINEKTVINDDLDLKLTEYFKLSRGYFLRLENNLP